MKAGGAALFHSSLIGRFRFPDKRIALNVPTFPESNRTMKRYSLLILLAAFWGFAGGIRAESLSALFTNVAPAATTAVPRRPNILWIMADSLGYGDLSCYGQAKYATPNLDRLAAGGARFTRYATGAGAGLSAQAGLLLGQESAPAGKPVPKSETVAQELKRSGYHTGLIGQWELGNEASGSAPWDRGFDEFAGYFDAADAENYYVDYIWRYAPRSLLNATNNRIEDFVGREMLYSNVDGKRGQYLPDLYTKAAMNFISNNRPEAANRYRPFFLLLNYPTPRPNAALARRTGNGMQVPTDAPFSSETWPAPEKNRAAMIARLDGDIGKLVEQLEKNQQVSNTVVFFSSAGPARAGGGVNPDFFRSNLASNDLRVPLLVSCPGKIPAGQVSDQPSYAVDWAPTALQIALVKPAAGSPGSSLWSWLCGERTGSSAPRKESARPPIKETSPAKVSPEPVPAAAR